VYIFDISKSFSLLLVWFSMVHWILGCMELNYFSMSSVFVQSSLYIMSISSTYL
jgi:hypothetical protein